MRLELPTERLMSRGELADYLNVSLRTVDRLVSEGRIPVVRAAARVARFDRNAVVRALSEKPRTSSIKGESADQEI